MKIFDNMSKQLKALVVGDFLYPIYEDAISSGLRSNGIKVDEFSFSAFFNTRTFVERKICNLQIKFSFGPKINEINKKLSEKIDRNEYDFIFFYRPRILDRAVLSAINSSICFCYNNDDPFSSLYPRYYWWKYFSGLKYFDHIFYYRIKNKHDYLKSGLTNTSLLRSYYIKELNYKINRSKKYDVVFIGHYEDDGRDEYLKFVLDNGVDLKIFGTGWEQSKFYDYFISKMKSIARLGKEYNVVVNEAKIALVFLSKLNSDTYTRRCFEIPAAGTFMLSVYTDDLNSMFEAGKEACYFNSKEDLLEKIRYYLKNEYRREQIALSGYQRLLNDGHEVSDRVKQIVEKFREINEAKSNH